MKREGKKRDLHLAIPPPLPPCPSTCLLSTRVTKFALWFYAPSPSSSSPPALPWSNPLLIALPHYCPTFMALPHYHPFDYRPFPSSCRRHVSRVVAREVYGTRRSLMEKGSLLQVRRRCRRRAVARLARGGKGGWARGSEPSESRGCGSSAAVRYVLLTCV